MRKHSAAIIQHYYGKLPNYFPLWLKSAGCNPQFDFMIFTDCDFSGYKVPGNVHVIHMTFDELRARIAQHLDFPFVCDTAYKACDYRPMYGLIFEDYLADYEFWGTCDPDEIWGDMGRFITPEILDNYSRIYRLGHLQLFRNTEDVRTFALHELPSCPFSYKDIFRTKAHIAYEEKALAAELFSRFTLAGGGGQYWSPDYADVHPYFKQFLVSGHTVPAFRWENGRIFGLSLDGKTGNDTEYLYVHLQKRAMNFTPGLEDEDSFMIVPNEFVKDHELTEDEAKSLMTPDAEYERAMRRKISRSSRGFFGAVKAFLETDSVEKRMVIYRLMCRLLGKKSYI